jgi:phytoene dehydrogenase-like protein
VIGTARAEVPRRVAVIGGGITGLLAAVGLAGAGAEVTVVERSETVGGQIQSAEVHGMTVDLGAESLHPAVPGIRELLQRVGLQDGMVDARRGPNPARQGPAPTSSARWHGPGRSFATVAGGHLPHALPRRVAPRGL